MAEPCKYEENIGYMKATLDALDKRINGSIDDIEKHISHGQNWRISIIGIATALILQIIVYATMWGQLCETVKQNSYKIYELQQLHPRKDLSFIAEVSNGEITVTKKNK